MSRQRILVHASVQLLLVSLVSVVAADHGPDPAALIPGSLGSLLWLPVHAEQRGVAPGLVRWAPACIGAVLVMASLLTQGVAMVAEPLLAASSLPLCAAICALGCLLPAPLGDRIGLLRGVLAASAGLAVIAASFAWYDAFGIHQALPVVLPALTVVVGLCLLGTGWRCLPDHPGPD
jgi:hypothetical protein